MATDPLQQVEETRRQTPLDLDLRRALRRLTGLTPSKTVPYLTVSLDWRPAGEAPANYPAEHVRRSEIGSGEEDETFSRRPARRQLNQKLKDLIEEHGPRGEVFDSLTATQERIFSYLDGELDPSAQGVVIVAGGARNVFETIALGTPVPTRLSLGPIPALSALARVADDFPTYAVLLADQREATLSFLSQMHESKQVALDASGYPRHQQQGGWSQRRYQARADERIEAFATAIAEEVRQELDESGVDMLIVAGDEVITSALDDAFHQTVKDRIIGTVHMDIRASEQDIAAGTWPLVEQRERQTEADAVAAVQGGVGAGDSGVAGAEDTVNALQAGQVETLVMVDDFSGQGWADYELGVYGVGDPPAEHPVGGNVADMVPVALDEELIRLAFETDADVQIVKTESPIDESEREGVPEAGQPLPRSDAATSLDELGSVGAVLRFPMIEGASTGSP